MSSADQIPQSMEDEHRAELHTPGAFAHCLLCVEYNIERARQDEMRLLRAQLDAAIRERDEARAFAHDIGAAFDENVRLTTERDAAIRERDEARRERDDVWSQEAAQARANAQSLESDLMVARHERDEARGMCDEWKKRAEGLQVLVDSAEAGRTRARVQGVNTGVAISEDAMNELREERDAALARAEKAEAQVAALREALAALHEAAPEVHPDPRARWGSVCRDAQAALRDTEATAKAHDERVRAEERTRMYDGFGELLGVRLGDESFTSARLVAEHDARVAAEAERRLKDFWAKEEMMTGCSPITHANIAAEARAKGIEAWIDALDVNESWPVADMLEKLAGAAEHLLRGHDCDAHGWEEVSGVAIRARSAAKAIRETFAREAPETKREPSAPAEASLQAPSTVKAGANSDANSASNAEAALAPRRGRARR